jgi:4-hydroxythreonine-4-phosphate dehydrogenase
MEFNKLNERHLIAITMGDPAGIGSEIAVKALRHESLYKNCIPIVIGDKLPILDAISFTKSNLAINELQDVQQARGEYGMIDLINMDYLKSGSWEYKKVCRLCGEASFHYILKGIDLAMNKQVHAVVTGPINKEAINLAGYHYSGHTEIFAQYTHTDTYGMLLSSGNLRIIHVTTHVSMREACDLIYKNSEKVRRTIELANEAMIMLDINQPKIGVAGLNAHASENGLFGDEEEISIIPAIQACRAKGMIIDGPVPPDTVFVKALAGQYDVVVAMYHDQGHIPLKLSGFKMDMSTGRYTSMSGVNSTIGLPIIRTSVDHGTAYGKAGEGRANEESLVEAIEMAIAMANKRFPR